MIGTQSGTWGSHPPELVPRSAVRTPLQSAIRWVFLTVQLGLILFTIHSFQIEKAQGLLLILPIVFTGFIIFHILPFQFRFPFFFLLSCAALFAVLGAVNATIAIAIGVFLFVLCNLPIRRFLVVLLLLLSGGLLALLTIGRIPTSWASSVVPVVGSMFMFRAILYLQERGRIKTPDRVSNWQRLSYFFLLPNVCFLVFPPVDYASFLRCYEQDDPVKIRQKGINWMFWGILHLLLYRIIYYYWVPDPAEVNNLRELIVYLITAYLFILRLAGQAYLAIGIVCLFGFDLPTIFHNYFLATNFGDFWRRTYIYWKDFVSKIFYYRVFFLFRKRSLPFATGTTTLIMFVITWALHSYQFFWIKGVFPLQLTDLIFWNAFGVMACINAIVQLRHSKKKILGERSWSFVLALKRSFHGVLFIFAMSLLLSLWSSSSLRSWLNVLLSGSKASFNDVFILAAGVLLVILLATLLQYLYPRIRRFGRLKNNFYAVGVSVSLVLCMILGIKMKSDSPAQNSQFAAFIISIREPRPNKRDMRTNIRGYYEPLMQRERFTAQFSETQFLQVQDEPEDTIRIKPTNDLRLRSYAPSTRATLKGKIFTTNRWGFRDREYTLEKPADTYRFAVLGGSMEVGSGVANQEIFENLIEIRLNENRINSTRYEILNFAMGGNSLLKNMEIMKKSVFTFQPDSLLVFVHSADDQMLINNLNQVLNHNIDLEYPELKEILNKAGVTQSSERENLARKILPYTDQIFDWLMETIASECRQHHVRPIAVLMPGWYTSQQFEKKKDLALRHGFHFIDVTSAYPWDSRYWVTPWDIHPNALGHKLIAQTLYEKLKKDQEFLGIHIR